MFNVREVFGSVAKEKMIQESSDGPERNLHFLKILAKSKDENLTMLIDLGICRLHRVHNAINHGDYHLYGKQKS